MEQNQQSQSQSQSQSEHQQNTQSQPQSQHEPNLENQQTDDEDSIQEIEFDQQYPNLIHIVKITSQNGEVIYEKEQSENVFNVHFKGHDLQFTLNPPSKGQIKTYKDDWENAFDSKLGVYCDIVNVSQNNDGEKLEMEVYDTPNKEELKREHVQKGDTFECDQITDNDYGTRDWEALHFYIGNNKYIVDTLIKNPFQAQK